MYKSTITYFIVLCLLCRFTLHVQAQEKPPISASAVRNWTEIGDFVMADNGTFFAYQLKTGESKKQLVLASATGRWTAKYDSHTLPVFTDDSRTAIFLNSSDTLCLLTLTTKNMELIPAVDEFCYFKSNGNQCLFFTYKDYSKGSVVLNLSEHTRINYKGHAISDKGNRRLLFLEANPKSGKTDIFWTNMGNKDLRFLASVQGLENITFDERATQMAFTESGNLKNHTFRKLWLFKFESLQPQLAVLNPGGDDGTRELSVSRFSKDGQRLFLYIKQPVPADTAEANVSLDLWHYRDSLLQSEQLKRGPDDRICEVIRLDEKKQVPLQRSGETVETGDVANRLSDHYVTISPPGFFGSQMIFNWSSTFQTGTTLVSTLTGRRTFIRGIVQGRLSPDERFVIGQDSTAGDYFCYDISRNTLQNVTQNLPVPAIDRSFDYPLAGRKPRGLFLIDWTARGNAVLFTDGFDIWQVDPNAAAPPVCLTNGFGRKMNIRFILPEKSGIYYDLNRSPWLRAVNLSTRESGFYRLASDGYKDPLKITMGPFNYTDNLHSPLKAKGAKIYLVARNSGTGSTNLYRTTDFRKFTPLTNNHPEEKYNWLRGEIHTFQTADGKTTRGILYKPEDFDSKKSYPVIFHYYEKMSDKLNSFQLPQFSTGDMNIPWFVSNGYLVFTPDIQYAIGYPGRSALNAVLGAVRYLKQFRYVDTTKMGLQGHSFGGFETNYIVSHSGIFAAASSASGVTNSISRYNGLFRDNTSGQPLFEVSQTRIGATLWERPDLYIENSPILKADRINTPLLLMHNLNDEAVPFSEGVQLFSAMRRLGKRCWMLQYDHGGHGLYGREAIDYQTRLSQFFDHYLKGRSAAKWMVETIPAAFKITHPGLELVPGLEPGAGLLKPAGQQYLDSPQVKRQINNKK